MSSLIPHPHRHMSFREDLTAQDFMRDMNADTFAEALAVFTARTMADTVVAAGLDFGANQIATAAIPMEGRYWTLCVGDREPGTRQRPAAYSPSEFVQLVRGV